MPTGRAAQFRSTQSCMKEILGAWLPCFGREPTGTRGRPPSLVRFTIKPALPVLFPPHDI